MARRTADKDEKRRLQIAFYKWEFLRQNTAYQKDFRSLIARYGDKLSKARYYPHGSIAHLKEPLKTTLGKLHYKWGVGFMQNPDCWAPLEDLLRKRKKKRNLRLALRNPFWQSPEFSILKDSKALSMDTVRFNGLVFDLRFNWKWLPLVVNLETRPESLQQSFVDLLKKVQNERKSARPIRLEATVFKNYLKAWNSKQKGHSIKKITSAINTPLGPRIPTDKPDLPAHRLRSAKLRRTHRAIQHARKLIAGSYRLIS